MKKLSSFLSLLCTLCSMLLFPYKNFLVKIYGNLTLATILLYFAMTSSNTERSTII